MQSGLKGVVQRFDPWGYVALIFILAAFCYWPALNGELLWDDPAHLTRPDLRSWEGLFRIWTNPLATQQYYPVVYTAFWIEHHLWGNSTLGYHLINVFQHAAAACMLALVLRRFRSTAPAIRAAGSERTPQPIIPTGAEWFAAVLFTVHPICVESVAWICEQKNTLSLLFTLGATYVWMGYVSSRRLSAWWSATLLFALALGTKTATVILPPALLVLLWWKYGRIGWKKDVVPLLPWFGLAVAAGLVTAWAERDLLGAQGDGYELSLMERVLLAGRIVWFYLGSQLWPVGQSFFNELWNVPAESSGWVGWLAASVGLTLVLWLLRQRSRGPLALWLLFVGCLFPVLGFFNVFFFAFSYVADHFQYIATLCFVSGAAIGATLLTRRMPVALRRVSIAAGGLLILVFALLSRDLSRNYQNNETLARASIARTPDNWMAHRILAWTLSKDTTRHEEAIRHYEKSLELNPRSPDSLHGLALLLARTDDRRSEAIELYEQAIALRPHFAEAHYALALEIKQDPARRDEVIDHLETALRTKPLFSPAHLELAHILARIPDRLPEAFFHYREALRLTPDYAEAHFGLANILAPAEATRAEAVHHYEEALRLEPGAAPVHYGLATALAATPNRMADAIHHLEETVRLDPEFAEAHGNLANALATMPDRLLEAIAHYQEAIRIDPNLAWAHLNLAMHLASQPGRQQDAIRHAEAGLRLDPSNLEARNGLAVLYVQQGDFDRARWQWEEALRIDPSYQTARDNLRTLDRIQQETP